jgi:predicted metal-binding membrane protein
MSVLLFIRDVILWAVVIVGGGLMLAWLGFALLVMVKALVLAPIALLEEAADKRRGRDA